MDVFSTMRDTTGYRIYICCSPSCFERGMEYHSWYYIISMLRCTRNKIQTVVNVKCSFGRHVYVLKKTSSWYPTQLLQAQIVIIHMPHAQFCLMGNRTVGQVALHGDLHRIKMQSVFFGPQLLDIILTSGESETYDLHANMVSISYLCPD